MKPKDVGILQRARDIERAHDADSTWLGSEWDELQAQPATLNRLVVDGLLYRSFRSNSTTAYKITEAGLQAIEIEEAGRNDDIPATAGEVDEGVPPGLFDAVVGYEDVKDALKMVAVEGRKVNVLLIGPPATAKSLLLMDLARLPGAYVATGSRVTAAGLTEALEETRPRLLVLDEVEKCDQKALSVLLSVMESGVVTVTKHGHRDRFEVDTRVVGAANTVGRMPPEFLSRFGFTLRLRPYGREEFLEVCRRYLIERENVPSEIAESIGEAVWEYLERDVRVARSIARMMREPTDEEVARWVGFLMKYGE